MSYCDTSGEQLHPDELQQPPDAFVVRVADTSATRTVDGISSRLGIPEDEVRLHLRQLVDIGVLCPLPDGSWEVQAHG